MIGYFVVSWFGNPVPDKGQPGIVRGTHNRAKAMREARYWDERLTRESGGLAVFCGAYRCDRARRIFDLTV